MIDIDRLSSNHKIGEWLISVAGFSTPVAAAAMDVAGRISPTNYPVIYSLLNAIKTNMLVLYIGMFSLFVVGKILSRKGERTIWLTLQSQVDTLAQIAFCAADGELNDNHRVTIFKFKKWNWARFRYGQLRIAWENSYWPNSGWLVPILRSGHTGKNTRTVFRAPDKGSEAEGLAGSCWSCDSGVFKENLPAITAVSSDSNKLRYSRATSMPKWMIEAYISESRQLSRSIFAFPVRTRIGSRWGVIVIDSQDRSGIDKASADEAFRTIIEPIGVLLEGI